VERITLLVVALLLAGCSSAAQATSTETPTPPGFDLETVKENFQDECKDPTVVDANFCEQVKIAAMTAEGSILNVPTTLNAAAADRARVICDMFATAHFDGVTGDDLGYETIGILDKDGGHAAACSV
jgi:hypothetical protein